MLTGQNNILKDPEKGEVGKYTHFLLWAANKKNKMRILSVRNA